MEGWYSALQNIWSPEPSKVSGGNGEVGKAEERNPKALLAMIGCKLGNKGI